MKEYVTGINIVRDLFKSLSSEGIEPPVAWSLPGQQKEPSQLLAPDLQLLFLKY